MELWKGTRPAVTSRVVGDVLCFFCNDDSIWEMITEVRTSPGVGAMFDRVHFSRFAPHCRDRMQALRFYCALDSKLAETEVTEQRALDWDAQNVAQHVLYYAWRVYRVGSYFSPQTTSPASDSSSSHTTSQSTDTAITEEEHKEHPLSYKGWKLGPVLR